MLKKIAIVSGPVFGALIYYLLERSGAGNTVARMGFVTCWMAIWWITEAVEIGITSLLPFALFPLFELMKAEDVAMQYMEQTIFLFIGGFFLAYAMEKWNLHHRLAYRIILITGSSPARILAGIMITTYLISMWISNTATTLMLLGAVLAIIKHEELFDQKRHQGIAAAFLIALAYSATIGGMATIVGTPTNMIFTGFWEEQFPLEAPVTFMRWCIFGIPFSLAMLITGFIVLVKLFDIKDEAQQSEKAFLYRKYKELGPMNKEQRIVLGLFVITAFCWLTRTGLDIGNFHLPGWSDYFGKGYIKDSTVAIIASVLLFVIPAAAEKGGYILVWDDVKKLPFHIILLFGGGFALARGINTSGLGNYMAEQLTFFSAYPLWVLIVVLVILVTLLSELASNVATITLMLPVLASLSKAIHVAPVLLMLPATFAASFGFMLHIATAPNTIVYATGFIPTKSLLKAGFLMNIAGIILLTLAAMLFKF